MSSRILKSILALSVILNVFLIGLLTLGVSQMESETPVSVIPVAETPMSFNNLPADIHQKQIVKVIGNQYALVAKSSLNVYMPDLPQGFEANYSGVLQWNENSQKWEKFLVIEDTNKEISSNNNPVDLWWEGLPDTDQVPHIVVVDSNGAGSGEGTAKELVAESIDLKEWKVVDCFDYAYDLGKGKQRSLSNKECQAVKVSGVDSQNE